MREEKRQTSITTTSLNGFQVWLLDYCRNEGIPRQTVPSEFVDNRIALKLRRSKKGPRNEHRGGFEIVREWSVEEFVWFFYVELWNWEGFGWLHTKNGFRIVFRYMCKSVRVHITIDDRIKLGIEFYLQVSFKQRKNWLKLEFNLMKRIVVLRVRIGFIVWYIKDSA